MNDATLLQVTWHDVAPLLARYEMALFPVGHGAWDVLTGYASGLEERVFEARQVPWTQIPQAIQALAAQCEAAEKEEET